MYNYVYICIGLRGQNTECEAEVWRILVEWNYVCGDEGPNLYIGPWALFDNVDTFEEE